MWLLFSFPKPRVFKPNLTHAEGSYEGNISIDDLEDFLGDNLCYCMI